MAQGTSSGIMLGLLISIVCFIYVGVAFSGQMNFPQQVLTYLYIIGPVSVIYLLKYILTIFLAIRLQFAHRIFPVKTWELVTYAAVASTPPFVHKAYVRMHLLAFTLAIISPGLARWGTMTEYKVQHNVTRYGDTCAYGIGGCDMILGRCYMCSNELVVNQTRTVLSGHPFTYTYVDPITEERFMPLWPVVPGFNRNDSIGKDETVFINLTSVPGAVYKAQCDNVLAVDLSQGTGDRGSMPSNPKRPKRGEYCSCYGRNNTFWAGLGGQIEIDVDTEPTVDGITYKKWMDIKLRGANMYMMYSCNATIQIHYMDALWLVDKGTVRLIQVDNKQEQPIPEYNARLANNSDELRVVYSNTFGYLWDHQSSTFLQANETVPKLFDVHIQTLIMRASGLNSTLFVNQVVKNATFIYVQERLQPGAAFTWAVLSVAGCATLAAIIWCAFMYCSTCSQRPQAAPMFTGNILQVLMLFSNNPQLLLHPDMALKLERSKSDIQSGSIPAEEGVHLVGLDPSGQKRGSEHAGQYTYHEARPHVKPDLTTELRSLSTDIILRSPTFTNADQRPCLYPHPACSIVPHGGRHSSDVNTQLRLRNHVTSPVSEGQAGTMVTTDPNVQQQQIQQLLSMLHGNSQHVHPQQTQQLISTLQQLAWQQPTSSRCGPAGAAGQTA